MVLAIVVSLVSNGVGVLIHTKLLVLLTFAYYSKLENSSGDDGNSGRNIDGSEDKCGRVVLHVFDATTKRQQQLLNRNVNGNTTAVMNNHDDKYSANHHFHSQSHYSQ